MTKLSRRSFMQRVAKLAAVIPAAIVTKAGKDKLSALDDPFIPVDHLDKQGKMYDFPMMGMYQLWNSDGYTTTECHYTDWKRCKDCIWKDSPNRCDISSSNNSWNEKPVTVLNCPYDDTSRPDCFDCHWNFYPHKCHACGDVGD